MSVQHHVIVNTFKTVLIHDDLHITPFAIFANLARLPGTSGIENLQNWLLRQQLTVPQVKVWKKTTPFHAGNFRKLRNVPEINEIWLVRQSTILVLLTHVKVHWLIPYVKMYNIWISDKFIWLVKPFRCADMKNNHTPEDKPFLHTQSIHTFKLGFIMHNAISFCSPFEYIPIIKFIQVRQYFPRFFPHLWRCPIHVYKRTWRFTGRVRETEPSTGTTYSPSFLQFWLCFGADAWQ